MRRVSSNLDREFLYLARGLQPADARKVRALQIAGVNLAREYRRYYPAGEVTGHLLGFTSIDDGGQEGLELAFDNWLAGEDGAKRVIQDSNGNQVEDVESIRAGAARAATCALSIDLRIQYLAYRELKSAIRENRARSGSVVVIDVRTGEVLAMVNQPAFNPNDREQLHLRPIAIARRPTCSSRARASSRSSWPPAWPPAASAPTASSTPVPASSRSAPSIIEDEHHLGRYHWRPCWRNHRTSAWRRSRSRSSHADLDHAQRLRLRAGHRQRLSRASRPGSCRTIRTGAACSSATMSHGYGLSVTPLQLAQAYATIGAFGLRRPVSLLRVDGPVAGERVLDGRVCKDPARAAGIGDHDAGRHRRPGGDSGYRVAGKTGTAWKAEGGGYSQDRFVGTFAGVAPASSPRLAAVVVIDEPSAGKHTAATLRRRCFPPCWVARCA